MDGRTRGRGKGVKKGKGKGRGKGESWGIAPWLLRGDAPLHVWRLLTEFKVVLHFNSKASVMGSS